MPIPIKPVHSLDLHAELFDGPSMEGLGLSDIQIQMLGISNAPKKEASVKLSDKYITMLKAIDQNINEIVTAANIFVNNPETKFCSVPSEISDNDLLSLKTAGLISGNGRTVNLTERGKLTLRDFYLSTENTNEFRKARTKDKFNLNEAREVKVANTKFKKVASWLTSFDNQFDVRFVADTEKTRRKGLMFAKPLEEYEVVYFIFDYPDGYSFWNKNVDFPLTLAFCDGDGKILDFKDLDANSEKSVGPDSNKVKIVVEANKDTFEKLGIKVGDKLILKDRKLILDKKTKWIH